MRTTGPARFRRSPLLLVVLFVGLFPEVARAQAGVSRGRDVFQQECAMCHGDDASGMMGMHPSLRGAAERLTTEGVGVTIRNGRRTDPPMPAFEDRLSDAEIEDVIAYLDTLPVGPRNFGVGERGGMNGRMGGAAIVIMIAFLVVLALAIAGVTFLLRRGRSAAKDEDPVHILERRFARGEITREELEESRQALRRSHYEEP